eukprot:TRINITY_DN24830_c0_g1_i1.p1 TRINITY_DN24830_c0_g1~~TRINITY_DN24830_c0_g1_i1.p1  ORF type:complete len:787 (-),score=227.15 TRINITY_DN24830_c0_g1_i1:125-2485(-)
MAAVGELSSAEPHRPKKLVLSIKPLQRTPHPPGDFLERSWATLEGAVSAVFNKGPLPCSPGGSGPSLEELYRLVEALCRSGFDAQLASRLRAKCEQNLSKKLAVLAGAAAGGADGSGDAAFLPLVHTAWQDHCEAMRTLCDIFAHLDRTWILNDADANDWGGGLGSGTSRPRPSLWACSLQLLRGRLDALVQVRERTVQGMLRLLDADRKGSRLQGASPASWLLIGSLVGLLVKVDLYGAVLEPQLLQRASAFYEEEAKMLLPKTPAIQYLSHCERRLEEERRRCETCLEPATTEELLRRVQEELLKKPCQEVLENGFQDFVANHQVANLAKVHRLFGLVDELTSVRKAWGQAIQATGRKALEKVDSESEESKTVIPSLFDLRTRLLQIHEQAFSSSVEFGMILKDSFEGFLNAGAQNLPAKLLARYVDDLMRNERASSDAEIEQNIDHVMGIFRAVSAKDAFETFYKKDLARRLLQQTNPHPHEELVVQRLREECGGGYTSKLEGMFRDVTVSKELLSDFLARPDARAAIGESATTGALVGALDFAAHVVTTGLWPTQPPTPDIAYPSVPRQLQDLYESYYTSRFTGRSLRWSPCLGQCTLRASYYGGNRKELVVSIFQALVCLLFNRSQSLSYRDIVVATQIPAADLQRTLQSLALHKHIKVLLKDSKTREVAETDKFFVNTSLGNHKLYRLIVPQLSAKDQQDEENAAERRVVEDRHHEVDAAIVRVMKTKRRLSHTELVSEVFQATRFPLEAVDVKARIESLVEREYLERDAERSSTYKYVA